MKEFSDQIEAIRDRMANLRQKVDELTDQPENSVKSIFAEIFVGLGELQQVQEECWVQNEELMLARQAIEAQRQRYQDLFEFAPDAYLVTDETGRIQEANCAAAILLNVSQEFLVGKLLLNFVSRKEHQNFNYQLNQLCDRVSPVQEWEIRLRPRQRQSFDAALRVAAFRTRGSQKPSLRWLVRDITPQKQAEKELQTAKEELEIRVEQRTADLQAALERSQQSEEIFRCLSTCSPLGIFMTDAMGNCTYTNKRTQIIGGTTLEEDLGEGWVQAVHPEDRDWVFARWNETISQSKEFYAEFRQQHKHGKVNWVSSRTAPMFNDRGELIGHVGTLEDISDRKQAEAILQKANEQLEIRVQERTAKLRDTNKQLLAEIVERKRTEAALRESEERYRELIELSPDGIFIQCEGKIVFVNNQCVKILGAASAEEILGKSVLEFLPSDAHEMVKAKIQHLTEKRTVLPLLEEKCLRVDETVFDAEIKAASFTYESKPAVQAIIRDITDRKRAEETIHYQAFHDQLTGLPNRKLFNEKLLGSLETCHQQQNMMAVMFLDMDRFKTINDTLGHAIGDKLLQGFAERVKSCLREGDIVSRWGGDEFTVLLPHINEKEDVSKIAQRILGALKQPFYLEEDSDRNSSPLHITTSIGIALYPRDGRDDETLLKNADSALYRAKEYGRNNYRFYLPAMNSQASALLSLENRLHQALERCEFKVYYQPQININTGEINVMEALVRWQHPELGLISPEQFIPLAEETGLIVPIGEWVLLTACRQNKAWQDAGLKPLKVAVNLSARQFQQPNLVNIVKDILLQTGLEPSCLELEITETTLMQNVDFAVGMLQDLQTMGVRLVMDDFGTGYSSLGYLKKFPFNALKIDQTFVRNLHSNSPDLAIVAAAIALGHGFNLSIVAEGVETREQVELLRNLKCEEMQGYFFSHPLPPDAIVSFVQTFSGNSLAIGNQLRV